MQTIVGSGKKGVIWKMGRSTIGWIDGGVPVFSFRCCNDAATEVTPLIMVIK